MILMTRVVICAGFLAWVCPSSHGFALAGAVAVAFDFGKAHDFGGYGVQIWSPPAHMTALVSLLRNTKFHFVRMSIPFKLSPEQLGSGTTPRALADAVLQNDDARLKQNLDEISSHLNSMDITVHLVNWVPPPPWVIEKPWIDGATRRVGKLADPAHTQDYANYVVAQILYGRQHGLKIATVELANEPDESSGTRWPPEQFSQLVVFARRALDSNGLADVKIEAPGTSSERGAVDFIKALNTSHAIGSVGAISAHDWDSRFLADPVGLSDVFQAALKSLKGTIPVHITEFNDESPRWWTGKVNNGKKRFNTESPEFAVALAAEALKIIGDGASEAILWEAEDLDWEQAYLGLLDSQGNEKPAARALRTFIALAPANSRVAPGMTSAKGIVSTGFVNAHSLVIAVANVTDEPQTLVCKLKGLRLNVGHISRYEGYAASDPGKLVELTTGALAEIANADSLTMKLPPQSVSAIEVVP